MSKRKIKISTYEAEINELNSKARELLSMMTGKSMKEFQLICDEYNRAKARVTILEKKIGNLKNCKHELGTGDELIFIENISNK
jgi:uncharacterized protein YydD (DUF2326 family)